MAPRSSFDSILIQWGLTNLPAAVSAINQLPHDRNWRARCLAAIFRARADADPAWLFETVEGPHGGAVREMAGQIGRAAGYPVAGSFAEWVDAVRAVAGVGVPPEVEEAPPMVLAPLVAPSVPAKKKVATLFEAA